MSEINPFLTALVDVLSAGPQTKHALENRMGAAWQVNTRTINQWLYRYEGTLFQKDRSQQEGLPTWALIPPRDDAMAATASTAPERLGNPLEIRDERWSRLREWQQEAIWAWLDNAEEGIVEAVTGAGKSDVAYALAEHYLNLDTRVLVIAHTNALKEQWARGLRGAVCDHLGVEMSVINQTAAGAWLHGRVLVAHPTTVVRAIEAGRLDSASIGLVVADEVHHYGADTWRDALAEGFAARLGLSATIERDDARFDDVLDPYFDGVVYQLDFERAYGHKLLAPFRLAYVGCEFSDEEQLQFDELSEKFERARRSLKRLRPDVASLQGAEFFAEVSRLAKSGDDRQVGIAAGALLSTITAKRELCATCQGKVALLPELLKIALHRSRTIVFAQTKEAARLASQASAFAGVVGVSIDSDTPADERERIFRAFQDGHIRVLAGPKLLDEGLDIPAADFGVVVSASRSRRQMVQRLGRLLRKKENGGDAAIAVMYVVGTNEDPSHPSRDGFISDLEDLSDPPFQVFVGDDDVARLQHFLLP
jgi:superfamily II DNA or RNA helicase